MIHASHVGTTISRQVVFVGPMGVGKTTATHSLSQIPVVGTEVLQSTVSFAAVTEGQKVTTTVGIEYGEWTSPDGQRVGLYGTPGQIRFAKARSSIIAQRSRIVLWIFGDEYDVPQTIEFWLNTLGDSSAHARTVIAVTRIWDVPDPLDLNELRSELAPEFQRIPLIAADPRNRDDVAAAVMLSLRLNPTEAGA